MPDLPKIEDPTEDMVTGPPTAADASATADDPETVQPVKAPAHRLPRIGTVVTYVVLALVIVYGAAGFLREADLYDIGNGWAKPASPSLSSLSASTATAPPVSAPVPAKPAEHFAGPLRDQPPRAPPADLPQFTLRDGEPHDFLTDLDAETLKRLADLQGQMDGLGALAKSLNQAVRALARTAGQQQQTEAAYQVRVQQEMAAARQEIAALRAAVQEVEARLKRIQGVTGAVTFKSDGTTVTGGRPLPGWSVKAISGDRAWLRTPNGREVTVVAGERLKTLGAVHTVDAVRGVVVMGDGRVVR